jgi:hypothetical protein
VNSAFARLRPMVEGATPLEVPLKVAADETLDR